MKLLLAAALFVVSMAHNYNVNQWPLGTICHAYRGKAYHFVEKKLNHRSARYFCRTHGMRLSKFSNVDVEGFLLSKMRPRFGKRMWWVGCSDKIEEGQWLWDDGSEVNYHKWATNKPDGGRGRNCGVLGMSNYPFWIDESCNHIFNFVCEKENSHCGGLVPDYCYAIFGKAYYLVEEEMNYAKAMKNCQKRGMSLAQITNRNLESILLDIMRIISQQRMFWVGCNDFEYEGEWKWDDDTTSRYTAWNHGEPNGGRRENCAVYGLTGGAQWSDVFCSNSYKSVCQIGEGDCGTLSATTCHTFRGSAFHFVDTEMKYWDARSLCVSNGMILAKITDPQVEDFLLRIMNPSIITRMWWVGCTDSQSEGHWVWQDESAVRYTAWATGEPEGGRTENCAVIGWAAHNRWIDVICENSYKFVCQKENSDCGNSS